MKKYRLNHENLSLNLILMVDDDMW